MRASPQADLERHLGDLYRSALLSGRVEATRALADDVRVNIDEVSRSSSHLLIEEAAALGQTGTCRVLIESGRLDATFAAELVVARIVELKDYGITAVNFPLRDMILSEGWSDSPFCRQYLDAISRTLRQHATVDNIVSGEQSVGIVDDQIFTQTRNVKERSRRYRQERRLVAELRGDDPLNMRGPKRRQRLSFKNQELNRRRVERNRKTGDY